MQAKSPFNYISLAAIVLTALQISICGSPYDGKNGMALAIGSDANRAAHASAPIGESKPEPPKRDYAIPVLGNLAKEYKESPGDISFGKYFTYLRDVLASGDFAQANPADLLAANPSLNDLHVKVNDAGAKDMHLWSFPSIAESHAVIFVAPGKTTAIPLPLSIVLREGRIVPSPLAAPGARPTWVKVVLKGKGKGKGRVVSRAVPAKGRAPAAAQTSAAAPALAAFGKYLVLIGGDRQTNTLWLKGFKLGDGPLVEAPELFAALPVFFTQNVSGKASFSGSDIVLTIQPPSGPSNLPKDPDEKPEVVIQANGKPLPVKPVATAVAGYKVVLKYMGGKFALAGNLPDDAPLSVAMAFCQNICAGHSDVAKGWLSDPKLISIPKYLGLVGRTTPPMRLVAMTGASGSRYRLITSAKDDLIIDVGRITTPGKMKGQLAVKAIFIAPPDAYAAKLTGTIVMPQPAANEVPEGDNASPNSPKPGTKPGTKSSLPAR